MECKFNSRPIFTDIQLITYSIPFICYHPDLMRTDSCMVRVTLLSLGLFSRHCRLWPHRDSLPSWADFSQDLLMDFLLPCLLWTPCRQRWWRWGSLWEGWYIQWSWRQTQWWWDTPCSYDSHGWGSGCIQISRGSPSQWTACCTTTASMYKN